MKLKLSINPNDQLALLADKKTQMKSLGEIDITVLETSTQILSSDCAHLWLAIWGSNAMGDKLFI